LKQFYKKKLQKKIKRQGLKLKGKEIEGLLWVFLWQTSRGIKCRDEITMSTIVVNCMSKQLFFYYY
jgi:hypothetical protein